LLGRCGHDYSSYGIEESVGAVPSVPDPAKAKLFKTVALAFGTGHHSLNPDAFERNFGLRVVLNSVSRSSLRSLDVAILDATTFQKRIQASRNADLEGFGINVERDLLRLASGVPKDTSFAKSAAGRDVLPLCAGPRTKARASMLDRG
jgi:uncharacterized protein (TIGR04141 family)